MGLDDIFLAISILFFCGMIFFIFKKPKLMNKLEAVLLCLLGTLIYGCLSYDYEQGLSEQGSIFGIVSQTFFVALIFSILGKVKLLEKWQTIILCLFGFMFYGCLWAACFKH